MNLKKIDHSYFCGQLIWEKKMELKDTWLALKTIGELFITVFGFSLGFAFLYSLIFSNNENIFYNTTPFEVDATNIIKFTYIDAECGWMIN